MALNEMFQAVIKPEGKGKGGWGMGGGKKELAYIKEQRTLLLTGGKVMGINT